MRISINRICFLLISVSLLFACTARDPNVDTIDSTDVAARAQPDDESVLNFDSSDTLPKISSGDTIRQRLSVTIDDDEVQFSIVYRVRLRNPGDPYWQINLIKVSQSAGTLRFSDEMIGRFREDFENFYHIPEKNYQHYIRPELTIKDVEYFLILRDYNLDGITDVGISQTPSGNNVFEYIYVNLKGHFVYWSKLSGNPVYAEHPGERKVRIIWHQGAELYVTFEYEISADTTLRDIRGEEVTVLDDEKLLKKIYREGKLVRVDTVSRF